MSMATRASPDIDEDMHYKKLEDDELQGKVEQNVSSQTTEKQPTKSVMYALCACCCYAVGNYIIGGKSYLGFLSAFSAGAGTLVLALVYLAVYAANQVSKGQKVWCWKTSYFRHPEGGLNYFNIKILFFYILNNIGSAVCIMGCFMFALEADLNQGIITSLFGSTAFFSAIAAYYFFDEKLKKSHVIGIVLMLICVVGLSLGSTILDFKHNGAEPHNTPGNDSTTQGSNRPFYIVEDGAEHNEYAILAILFGLLAPITFCMSGMIVRFADNGPKQKLKSGEKFNTFNSTDITIANHLGINVIFITCTIILYSVGSHPFDFMEYLQMASAGLIAAVGVVFMNHALIIGYAGPVFALCNMQVIIQATLDILFLGEIPNAIEIVAACFGILGSCIIALMS